MESLKNKKESRLGKIFTNNVGYSFQIIEYFSATDITIRFEDGYTLYHKTYTDIKKGEVKNPLSPLTYGIGFLGVGKYIPKMYSKSYSAWTSMLQRCYDVKYHKNKPTYIGCSVDLKWHNYQNFAEWFEQNYVEGFELDKDILVKGNKVYSPETCCFVPREINSLFKGYSKPKIDYLKEVADKWKTKITTEVYKAICNE